MALKGTGLDLFAEHAFAPGDAQPLRLLQGDRARPAADALEVPQGFRADVLISWGDTFRDRAGEALRYGFNNDFLALLPAATAATRGSCSPTTSTRTPSSCTATSRTAARQDAGAGPEGAGRRRATRSSTSSADANGAWKVVSPLALQPPHLRRPARPRLHRPAARAPAGHRHDRQRLARQLLGRHHAVGHGALLRGELRRLRPADAAANASAYGWEPVRRAAPSDAEYDVQGLQEVRLGLRARPVRPRRAAAQAHRARPLPPREHGLPPRAGQAFVLYMGDDKANEGVYKFVSDRGSQAATGKGQPQDPGGGHALHRALGARGPAALRHRRRPRADQRHRGHRHLGAGA